MAASLQLPWQWISSKSIHAWVPRALPVLTPGHSCTAMEFYDMMMCSAERSDPHCRVLVYMPTVLCLLIESVIQKNQKKMSTATAQL
jgi:hypothetical protein